MDMIPHEMYQHGLRYIKKNIEELVTTAKSLNQEGYFKVAYVLTFTAWEEIGKVNMLIDF